MARSDGTIGVDQISLIERGMAYPHDKIPELLATLDTIAEIWPHVKAR